MWKDFFYYSRREKRGIIILIILIFIVIGINIFLSIHKKEVNTVQDEEFKQEYADFIASIKKQKEEQNRRFSSRDNKYNSYKEKEEISLFNFNPNEADSITFIKLGLPKRVAQNILKYRRKGGKFKTAEDLRKIYGMSEEKYNVLYAYIKIPETRHQPKDNKDTIQLITHSTVSNVLANFKYPAGTTLDLNQVDTAELKKIPGIGSGIARRIVNYRDKLGGFYDIEQLKEINLNTEKLAGWFILSAIKTKRLNINTASIERLKSHPYFNFYQAKVIVEHRKRKGKLKGLHQLSLYEEFTEKDFERIQHYVHFD